MTQARRKSPKRSRPVKVAKSNSRSHFDRLFDLLEAAGAKVTLYGHPVTREEVHEYCKVAALSRFGGKVT